MFRTSVTAILGGIEMLTWHTTVGSDGTRGSKCWTVDAEQKKIILPNKQNPYF